MKIALIDEGSQASKNSLVEQVLRSAAEPMRHTVFNYGMYADEGAHALWYVLLLTAAIQRFAEKLRPCWRDRC